jgi:succinate dehydrogenase / fumarate reductase cytochrome b subunit
MGITWGWWISPAAQMRASWVSLAFGVVLSFVGLGGLVGMARVDVDSARQIEDQMYNARVAAGDVTPNDHKRWVEGHSSDKSTEEKSAFRNTPAPSILQKK